MDANNMNPARSPRHAPSRKTADSNPPVPPSRESKENRSSHESPPALRPGRSSSGGFGQDATGLEAMRKKMSEALAQKHQMMTTAHANTVKSRTRDRDTKEQLSSLSQVESSSDESATTGTMSTDSARTIRPMGNTPGSVKTPSYPFPRMQMKLNRGTSHRSGPTHKPFTLLSPTNEPLTNISAVTMGEKNSSSSDVDTPTGHASTISQMYKDNTYPMPDLYEIILAINAEPGLEMWWANVCEILSDVYGAERASLALPGDVTDLENVPWGQKATFNATGSDSSGLSVLDSLGTSEMDFRTAHGRHDDSTTDTASTTTSTRRPPLQSRHSIAGPLPEITSRPRHRPTGPARANSSMVSHQAEQQPSTVTPRLTRQAPTPRTQSTLDISVSSSAPTELVSGDDPSKCFVYRALQPLEQEIDPLLVRTGISSLFGKRKPVVLTRTYSDDSSQPTRPSNGEAPRSPGSLSADPKGKRRLPERSEKSAPMRPVDEYEQPEPSPWSQSPSPSPAARPDPSESPFFNQTSAIDENAFTNDPPPYDYSAEANQSLTAIGSDGAKTLIHIPLILPARGAMASNLKFPIAILSFISPMNPYPLTLRYSLAYLLPHLAVSFSLAQQYSSLHDRVRGGTAQRHGAVFGLGGTFSDEGSELELVAELSGQVAREKERSSQSLPLDESNPQSDRRIKESPASSLVSTPLYDNTGFSPGMPPTPGRSGADIVEGYFSAKRAKGGKAATPGGRKSIDERSAGETSQEKTAASSRTSSRRETLPLKAFSESYAPFPSRPGSQTSESDYGGDVSGALTLLEHGMRKSSMHRNSLSKDEGEKPLPELISSLMLNAVPLQLFLAKPGTGDLVWTNRKFDAFRSQGEGRVRDPWKNVHSDDRNGLVKLWSEAMKSGSQFTHYIRVRRFNSDADFRWFVFRASTLLSNNGTLLYWIGSFLDVHEQYIKNLEASEKESSMARDAKIRAMADAIPQVLFEAIEGEGIVAVNQQWHTFSGQNLDDARGLGFARHVHRDDLHKCGILSPSDAAAISRAPPESDSSSSESSNKTVGQPPVRKTLFAPDTSALAYMIKQGSVTEEQDENGRLSYLTEIRLRSKRGEYRWFLVRLVRVDSALLTSSRASWYGTCTDIEIRKALERELNQANKKVHSEMESKTKFFANMSHEIRTPLNGILGSMPWLTESPLDLDQRRTVDTIQNSANNLRELVDNILDVTKVEAGKMTLLPKFFHVRTLCEEVLDTVSSRAIERNLELNYALDAHVPANVKGDPFRVRQVLLNLLGNSVKFTEQGEVYMGCTMREEIHAKPEGPRTALLSFDVADTGRGFNVGDFERLFKQFGQTGMGSNHDAGSGLGLFLSKQLVEMHGGELSVQSQVGEGSTFSFYIRVELAAPGEEATSPQPTSRARHRQSSSMSSRSQSETKTPTMHLGKPTAAQAVIQTPGLSRYITSPETQSPDVFPVSHVTSPHVVSPPITSSTSAQTSLRSDSVSFNAAVSPSTSLVPTPESQRSNSQTKETVARANTTDRQIMSEQILAMHPVLRRSKSDQDASVLAPDQAHPPIYSIVVICPAEHARAAIKQHIEHVVPLQIPTTVNTIKDIGEFLDLFNGPTSPTFTHIVLDIPASSDVMLFMRQLANQNSITAPALIIVTDHYQKRDIQEDFAALTASGRKAYLIHKPVKPSVFAMIFDPAQLRNLSKDRAREVAQTSSDDFRNTALSVKEAIGNKGHRVLLVEDSHINRKVIWKYLQKVGLDNDEAIDGQECVDLVFKQPPNYYSLIICDIQMPNKNGYEACMEIRQWEKEHAYKPVPIMALTANAMPEERAAAAAAGFTDYLTKPVEYGLLGGMMCRLLADGAEHVLLRDRPLEG